MAYRVLMQNKNKQGHFLSQFKAKGKRRLLQIQPKQQEIYIDTRNLWKASTTGQQKQYQSIRTSGLLNSKRKMTFLKFNYRCAQERNLCYPDVFKLIDNKTQNLFSSQTKIKKAKMNQEIVDLSLRVVQQVKQNSFFPEKNWLEEYHEKQKTSQVPFRKRSDFFLGSMNVNDLWGEKQLQQCLGYLPCKRDRPKMLKFYSSNLKIRKNKKYEIQKCSTEY